MVPFKSYNSLYRNSEEVSGERGDGKTYYLVQAAISLYINTQKP